MTDVRDCLSCGACCLNAPANQHAGVRAWVEVDADERVLRRARLTKLWRRDPDGAIHLRLDDRGRCVALRGRLGERVRCSIYEVRPRACRRVQPGDGECRRARREHGIA
jgi:Fe-S-cluster containining protein